MNNFLTQISRNVFAARRAKSNLTKISCIEMSSRSYRPDGTRERSNACFVRFARDVISDE